MLLLKQMQRFYISSNNGSFAWVPPQKLIALLLLHSSNRRKYLK
jgi:hypothetical protein